MLDEKTCISLKEVHIINYKLNPLERYVAIFKALSDIKRLKIMWLLIMIDSKISVSEMIDVLGETQYNVSKHLKVLKTAGLIYEKKEGKWSFYHYIKGDEEFDNYIRQTIMTIPKELLVNEIALCHKRLTMRVDGKCVVGAESDEWVEIKNDN